MSTSNYNDTTSYVSASGKANDYTPLQTYSDVGNSQAAPLQSVLKMSVAPGSQKYFSVAPSFQSRLDNFRIAPPSMTPVMVASNSYNDPPDSRKPEDTNFASSGDYANLGQSYKLTPY